MNNIKELFAPLSTRLFVYESKAYHDEPIFFDENGDCCLPHNSIIRDLYKNSSLSDINEFHREAEFYKARITKILTSLEIADYAYEFNFAEENKFALKKDDKILIEATRRDELQKYYASLETIQNSIPLNTANAATPKIQWLGKTNVLATLFYDMLNGQEKVKGKGVKTTKLIRAEKKDIINMLVNNFVDAKGERLNETTLSDYLNTSESRDVTRAKIGSRIELNP